MSSLQKKAIIGSAWVIIGYGTSQFLRLISNLILTRLLVPELFGLMALVNTFVQALFLFSDIGIKPNIIRSPRGDDPVFLNTAWTIQVIRGFALWISCLLISFPLAKFYQEPQLLWLIPIVAFNSCIISGFNSTHLATLNRNLEVGTQTLIDITTQIITFTITIIWAYFQPTIWALVIGNLVSKVVTLYWSHHISSTIHRFTWNKEAIKEITSFGRWIFLSTIMTFLATQSDKLILGKFLPLEMLGVYTIALTFASIPQAIIVRLTSTVIFPLFSKKINTPREQLRKSFLEKRQLIILASAFLLACIVCFGDIVILFLYDERYKDAAWILPILTLGLWPLILNKSIDSYLFSVGKSQYAAIGNFMKLIYMIFLLPLMFIQFNFFAAILVIAFNDLPKYFITNYGLAKNNFSPIKQDILMSAIFIFFIMTLTTIRFYYGSIPYVFNHTAF